MLLRREEPAAKLARRFRISEQTLYRWRDDFLAGGEVREGQPHLHQHIQRRPVGFHFVELGEYEPVRAETSEPFYDADEVSAVAGRADDQMNLVGLRGLQDGTQFAHARVVQVAAPGGVHEDDI